MATQKLTWVLSAIGWPQPSWQPTWSRGRGQSALIQPVSYDLSAPTAPIDSLLANRPIGYSTANRSHFHFFYIHNRVYMLVCCMRIIDNFA